jgi:hypothetical protein
LRRQATNSNFRVAGVVAVWIDGAAISAPGREPDGHLTPAFRLYASRKVGRPIAAKHGKLTTSSRCVEPGKRNPVNPTKGARHDPHKIECYRPVAGDGVAGGLGGRCWSRIERIAGDPGCDRRRCRRSRHGTRQSVVVLRQAGLEEGRPQAPLERALQDRVIRRATVRPVLVIRAQTLPVQQPSLPAIRRPAWKTRRRRAGSLAEPWAFRQLLAPGPGRHR